MAGTWIWKGIPVKNLEKCPWAFAPASAQANARAKVKGGGIIPESGCEVGMAWV